VLHRVTVARAVRRLQADDRMPRLHRSLGFALIVAGACASTATISSSWHAQNAPLLTNVVTLSPSGDAALRHSAEDQLAHELRRNGIRALPGYAVLNDQLLADHSQIIPALRAQGFDGVVTMRLVEANQQLNVYPGFEGYWGGAWGATVVPETVVRLEVNAYSLATQQLVFSAMSKSVDPDSAHQVIGAVAKVASNKLAQDHVIGPAQTATAGR
jgi:hypothetical protein